MEDVLVYLKSINWELLVTAILALVALRTSHFSIKSFYENQKSKRAFLAPDSDPGFFKIPNSNYDVFAKTVIKNFGTNPASKIISYVHFIAETQVKTEKKEMKRSLVHSFTLYSNSVNPIPNGVIFESAFKQKYFKENLILNDPIVPITFICQKLIYFDRVLEEEFTDTFFIGP